MQNFMQIPPKGPSRQMGEIYAKIFIAIHISRLYILSPSCRLSSVYYGSVWSEINKLID